MILRRIRLSTLRMLLLGFALGLLGCEILFHSSRLLFGPYPPDAGLPVRWLTRLLCGGSLLAAAGFLGAGLVFLLVPGWHPMYRALSAYGKPAEVAVEVDEELSAAETVKFGQEVRSFRSSNKQEGPVWVTASWVVQFTDWRLRVACLEEVVWVRRALGQDISGEARPSVEVWERNGRKVHFFGQPNDLDRLVIALVTRLPSILNEPAGARVVAVRDGTGQPSEAISGSVPPPPIADQDRQTGQAQ